MTKNIVLIFLKIFYKIYSGIIPDFLSNNLMEIITRIDPVFLAGNCWTCDGFLGCFNLIEVKKLDLIRIQRSGQSSGFAEF